MKPIILSILLLLTFNCHHEATESKIPMLNIFIRVLSITSTPRTISGTINGYTSTGLILSEGIENLSIPKDATTFRFLTKQLNGYNYSVKIVTQPINQTCTVANGSGVIAGDISNVGIYCGFTYSWGSFLDNANGTVTFTGAGTVYTGTKLIWMKCTQGQTWNSNANDCTGTGSSPNYGAVTYQACATLDNACDNGTTMTSGSAFAICNSLNTNPSGGFAGKTTWRLPTKDEFKSLVYCSNGTTIPLPQNANCGSNYTSPTINVLFPNTISGAASIYWSSSVNNNTLTWTADFSTGNWFFTGYKTAPYYVRCVSSGQ